VLIRIAISLTVGIAALFLALALRYVLLIARWLPRYSQWWRDRQGLCRGCGYNLSGNTSGVFPECGEAIDQTADDTLPPSPVLAPESQPWWVWVVVAAAMILEMILSRH
jgi:hypothetical protein